jgi:hypothetical protein
MEDVEVEAGAYWQPDSRNGTSIPIRIGLFMSLP